MKSLNKLLRVLFKSKLLNKKLFRHQVYSYAVDFKGELKEFYGSVYAVRYHSITYARANPFGSITATTTCDIIISCSTTCIRVFVIFTYYCKRLIR